MIYRKYQHIERIDSIETDGLLDGECHIFYKIDGTNASIWLKDNGSLGAGSRNRELSFNSDNAGFYHWVEDNKSLLFEKFFIEHPKCTLYGEWLVPHSLKTYRDNAWRQFYVFDVQDASGHYIPYNIYKPILESCGINYIPPLATIKNPTADSLMKLLDKSGEFLVKDGSGKGEGIVIKNYEFVNKFGRTTWGKIITNEFKEKHHKEMGAPSINNTLLIEDKIIEEFLTDEYIKKEQAKIMLENEGFWDNKFLPKLFGIVGHEFIRDFIHPILKKFKNPKIDFKYLNILIIKRCKEVAL